MLMFILGFLTCCVAQIIFAFYCDKTDQDMAWMVTELACWVALPFVWLACWPMAFFKNVVEPVPRKRFDQCAKEWADTMIIRHLFKNIYLHHDKAASKAFKHWFLVRVKD